MDCSEQLYANNPLIGFTYILKYEFWADSRVEDWNLKNGVY